MLNRPISLFLSALRGLRDFNALDSDDREIVFYAEDNGSWVFFEPIIRELLATHGKKICYLTSSPDDPVLTCQEDEIRGFYIGMGFVRTYLFLTLKAGIMVMTMPDLETYYIKRSKVWPVHYIYVYHSMYSTTMVYRFGAMDHFDAILCVGPHHINEIRATEKIYNLKPKILIESGYGRLDSIIEEAQNRPQTILGEGVKKVLLAPTWGDHALLETCAFDLVDILLGRGYQVIYRPHPMTVRHRKKLLTELQNKFAQHKNFKYETDVGTQESLHLSDILISDWSNAAIEYAFGLERPVISIDLPRKVNNPEYQKIDFEPFEVSIRSNMGKLIPLGCLHEIPKHIEELCSNPVFYKRQIREIRSKNIFNIGRSGGIGAAYIAEFAKKGMVGQ
jgi:hypothetical protein